MTMIERMARAMNPGAFAEGVWEPRARRFALDRARVALQAAREPTDAMVEACEENFAADAWRDMVDAALAEGFTAPDKAA